MICPVTLALISILQPVAYEELFVELLEAGLQLSMCRCACI